MAEIFSSSLDKARQRLRLLQQNKSRGSSLNVARSKVNFLESGGSNLDFEAILKQQLKDRNMSQRQSLQLKRDENIPLSIFDRQEEQRIKTRKISSSSNISQVKPIGFRSIFLALRRVFNFGT